MRQLGNFEEHAVPAYVPETCERCGCPLRFLVGLFGLEAYRYHQRVHRREDQANALNALLRGARAVANGEAPTVILLPLVAAVETSFTKPEEPEPNVPGSSAQN